jgi:threonine/homoserine/homoserine lactone efflux protein
MTLSYFIAYLSIIFFATIVPGPSMLLALNHGANHGIGKTVYSGLGNLTGNLLMALLSILGLGVLLMTSGIIFNIIKWLGIGYLVFIGIKMFFSPVAPTENTTSTVKKYRKRNPIRLFIDGFVIAIGNPKGILFFTALFPQFINIKQASIADFLLVFVSLAIVAFGCYMLYAIFGERLNQLFQRNSFRRFFNRITGSMFIGLGVVLAFSKR